MVHKRLYSIDQGEAKSPLAIREIGKQPPQWNIDSYSKSVVCRDRFRGDT